MGLRVSSESGGDKNDAKQGFMSFLLCLRPPDTRTPRGSHIPVNSGVPTLPEHRNSLQIDRNSSAVLVRLLKVLKGQRWMRTDYLVLSTAQILYRGMLCITQYFFQHLTACAVACNAQRSENKVCGDTNPGRCANHRCSAL